MSLTSAMSVVARNAALQSQITLGQFFSVLTGLTLQTATGAGAPTFVVDLSVAAGDQIVFDFGQATQEQVTVLSVTGSGPYTVTPTTALTKAHVLTGPNSGIQSHMPLSSNASSLHEVGSVTRIAANWGTLSGGQSTAAPGPITVPSGNKVGAVALYSAAATLSISGLSSATDTITETATGLANNDMIVLTAAGGTSAVVNTVYWVVSKSTNSFKIATSLGGTGITLGTGSGIAYTRGFYVDSGPAAGQNFPSSQSSVPVWAASAGQ